MTFSPVRLAPSGPAMTDAEITGRSIVRTIRDLPEAVGGIIDLEPGGYVFADLIDIGSARLRLAAAGAYLLEGVDQDAGVTSDAASGGAIVTETTAGRVLVRTMRIVTADASAPALLLQPGAGGAHDVEQSEIEGVAVALQLNGPASRSQVDRCRFVGADMLLAGNGQNWITRCTFVGGSRHIVASGSIVHVLANRIVLPSTVGIDWTNASGGILQVLSNASGSCPTFLRGTTGSKTGAKLSFFANTMIDTDGIDLTGAVPSEGAIIIGNNFDVSGNPIVGFTAATADVHMRANYQSSTPMSETAIVP